MTFDNLPAILPVPCPCYPDKNQAVRSRAAERKCSHNGDIIADLREHAIGGPGWEDTYLRIYPCDARAIIKALEDAKNEQ